MKYRILKYLVCPACRTGGFTVESHREHLVKVWASSFVTSVQIPEGVSMHNREEVEIDEGFFIVQTVHKPIPSRWYPRLILDHKISGEIRSSVNPNGYTQ